MNEEPTTITSNECERLRYVQGPINFIGDPNGTRLHDFWWYPRPILLAAVNQYDNHRAVEALIKAGADVNFRDRGKATALHYAAVRHKKMIVDVLLTYRADVHLTTNYGSTALHLAANSMECDRSASKYENDLSVIKALLQKRSDVNAQNNRGETPLMIAVQGCHLDIVKRLLAAGTDVSVRNVSNKNCLHLLLENAGKTDMMIELIRAGVPLQRPDENGRTPLQSILYSNRQHNEILEDIKALTKTGLLVNNEEKENYYVHQELYSFVDACHAEVERMRIFRFNRRLTLCDLALRGGGKAARIWEPLFEVMMRNVFDIYDDYIVANFEREYLLEKMTDKRIYATNVEFPKFLVHDFFKCLTNMDLLNLLRVYNN